MNLHRLVYHRTHFFDAVGLYRHRPSARTAENSGGPNAILKVQRSAGVTMPLSCRTIGHEVTLGKREALGISEGLLKYYRLGGSDGSRSLACINSIIFLPKHIAEAYLKAAVLVPSLL